MTVIGERILEFLMTQDDVSLVRDSSSSTPSGRPLAEEIRCRHGGTDYRVSVDVLWDR